MDILEQIKSDRVQRKQKKPLRPTLFDRISGLVKEYGLGESFLEKLSRPEDFLLEEKAEFARIRNKPPFRIPLFSMAEQKEYVITLAIINKIKNPYLEFAQSPEEIALSKLLFELNPALGEDKLASYHFETLLHYERAKITVKELAMDFPRQMVPGLEKPFVENEELTEDSPEKLLEQLQNFVAKVDESQMR
ncbi:MAG: hypothetical protein LJE89_05620 [Deltaproteobacteria bacterium]|nr:hypothetical protein [Deltaproteobacteria bacterium]